MRRVAVLVAAIVIMLVAAPPVRAAHCGARGATYAEALKAKAAARKAADAAVGATAEERLVERRTRYYTALYGRRVGRWFVLVHAYWPRAEWNRAMLCIRRESGGNPNALGSAGEIGLFQLKGFSCRPWRPETNVRLAAKMWRASGWGPWTTMQ